MEIYSREERSGAGAWSWCGKRASAPFKGVILLVGLKSREGITWERPMKSAYGYTAYLADLVRKRTLKILLSV